MNDPVHPHSHDAPDRFTRWGEDAGVWLEDHWPKVVGAVVLLIVVGAGWAWYDHSRDKLLSAARARVADIATQFPGGDNDVPDTVIRSALERYETFLKTVPRNSTPYWIARLNAAEAHDALGEADAAKEGYEAVAKGPAVFAGPARMRLAYLAAAGGDLKAAGAAFAGIVDQYPGLAPHAALEQGRMAEGAGETDVAIAAYRMVSANYGATPQASEAEARLKALGVEPEPAPAAPAAPAEPALQSDGGAAPEAGEKAAAPTAPAPAPGSP